MSRVFVLSSQTTSAPAANEEPTHPMERFFAATVRGLVEGQKALDADARQSLVEWERSGIPPSGFTWSECRLSFAVSFKCEPKPGAQGQSSLTVAPHGGGGVAGGLALRIRYLPKPQDTD